ncbi:MAG: hypothetical protein ACR2PS_09220 [Pseudomonadales bacterium]
MGQHIKQSEFSEADYLRFHKQLRINLQALKMMLDRPEFGRGSASIGAELELYIVDRKGRPLPINEELQRASGDPQLTLELNRYNLEYNLTPVAVASNPFLSLEQEIKTKLEGLNKLAQNHNATIVPIGILPTLQRRDFGLPMMTDTQRYHALTKALRNHQKNPFSIKINGADPISLRTEDVTFEGANTSLQLHYRVAPAQFAATFNAIQLVTPLVLAISANSPIFLGSELWQETRIPLFKHAIDGRNNDSRKLTLPARVELTNAWVRHGAYELFAESVHLHRALLPVSTRENAVRQLKANKVPGLHELRLHQGTVWPWNRPVYDSHGDGHLRIEMRALPAGPTAVDMMANCAFMIGLAEGLRDSMEDIVPALPIKSLIYNFYRAAEHGMQAELLWPAVVLDNAVPGGLEPQPVCQIAASLLPTAQRGLQQLGITTPEIDKYLSVIDQRLRSKQCGASWQVKCFRRLRRKYSRHKALALMLERYIAQSQQNIPVSEWQ